MVQIGLNRDQAWKNVLWNGFLDDSSSLMKVCKEAAGNLWSKLEGDMDIRGIQGLLSRGKFWSNSKFSGWENVPIPGKIKELRWRMYFKKVKMPREGFTSYEDCLWCGEKSSNLHIFLECSSVKAALLK